MLQYNTMAPDIVGYVETLDFEGRNKLLGFTRNA